MNEDEEIELLDDYNDDTISEDKSNSKEINNSKYIMVFILFIVLILLVFLFPYISSIVSSFNLNGKSYQEKKITSGTLKCSLNKNSRDFDYQYVGEFEFEDSKLLTLDFTSIIVGDDVNNKDELEKMQEICLLADEHISNLDGVSISCNLKNGKFIQKQLFVYTVIDPIQVKSSYSELSLIYPSFSKGDNIDEVERNMTNSNYNCKRYK